MNSARRRGIDATCLRLAGGGRGLDVQLCTANYSAGRCAGRRRLDRSLILARRDLAQGLAAAFAVRSLFLFARLVRTEREQLQ